jgi:hypothetical protein
LYVKEVFTRRKKDRKEVGCMAANSLILLVIIYVYPACDPACLPAMPESLNSMCMEKDRRALVAFSPFLFSCADDPVHA